MMKLLLSNIAIIVDFLQIMERTKMSAEQSYFNPFHL